MKRRSFLKGLSILPLVGLTPTVVFANSVALPTNSGLDEIISIIQNDERLNRRVNSEDIDEAIESAKRMNEIILEAIIQTGVANDKKISTADTRELNDYIFNNHHDEWIELHGNDEEESETGFHKVVNDGAKTKLYGRNAINKIFDSIYHLGFNTHLKNRLLNEDGARNTSYKNVAKWLDNLLRKDLENGALANHDIKEVTGETGTGLDQVIDIIYNDEGLNKKISIGDMRVGANSANGLNKLILRSIEATNAGSSGQFTVQNIKDMNSFLVDNYSSEWIELHGNDEEESETGFHKVQKDGAKTKLFGKNAINRVFDSIYHLGFETSMQRRLLNEDGDKNSSFRKVAQWLTALMQDDLDNDKEDLKILIPLYVYPDEEGKKIWQKLIDIKNKYSDIEITAIINPQNGTFDSKDDKFSEGIKDLVDANIRVVGYVYTLYAERNKDEVITDIEAWSSIYKEDGVSGLFFDETSIDRDDLDYYKDLTNEAKERELNFTILNPGITTDQEYVDSNIANIIVSYETTSEEALENPPSTYNEPTENTELSLLIYEMDGDKVDDLISFAREHDFSYIYFTEDGADRNPWDTLSEYFEDEVSKALV